MSEAQKSNSPSSSVSLSLEEAKKAVVSHWSEAAAYAHPAWTEGRLPMFIEEVDALILAAQSPLKAENERLTELLADANARVGELHHLFTGSQERANQAESALAEAKGEIERCRHCHEEIKQDADGNWIDRETHSTCEVPEQGEDDAIVGGITAIVREADKAFQASGGSSRHWVRDCFLPNLNEGNWIVVLRGKHAAAHRGQMKRPIQPPRRLHGL